MAVTSIWPIKTRLDRVIAYVRNPEKTTEKSYQDTAALHTIDDVIEYAANDMKTEERKYVSCIGFSREEAALEKFRNIQKLYGKTDGRICYHGYQSFKGNEVTAEQAHKIGVKLAENLWGNRYYVVVATHLNTGHFHNHFIINSVSHIDGIKFHNTKEDYQLMRQESDRLCKEYGLSVIRQTDGKSKNYSEWQAEKDGKLTQRDTIRRDIDTAIKASNIPEDFIKVMEEMGYQFKTLDSNGNNLKYPALKPPGAKSFFRFHRLGEEYELDRLIDRIYSNRKYYEPFPDLNKRVKHTTAKLNGKFETSKKYIGIYPTYMTYCYNLAYIRKYPTSIKRVSFLLREDIVKMDKLMTQSEVLGKYRIYTIDELRNTRAELTDKMSQLTDMRKSLRNMLKRAERAGDTDKIAELKEDIAGISLLLKETRKEVGCLNDVEERSAQIENNLKQIAYEKAKDKQEVTRYEPEFGRSRTAR